MRAPKPRPWGARPGLPFGSGHVIDPSPPDWDNLGKPWRAQPERIVTLREAVAELRAITAKHGISFPSAD